jgi:hypothetical protein
MSANNFDPKISRAERIELGLLGFAWTLVTTGIIALLSWGLGR